MARKKKPALVEVAVHQDTHPHSDGELIDHETYDHVYYLEDDPDTLLNEDGIPVKLDDVGEPVYDEETGLPKVRKVRQSKGEKTAAAKPRKIRIVANVKQQARLPLPGFMPYSRVMLDSGDFVRLMTWGRLAVKQLVTVHLDEAVEFVHQRDKTYQEEFRKFIQSHLELGQSYPLTDFRLVRAMLVDDSYTWAVAFPETVSSKGLSLQKILKAVAHVPSPALKKSKPAKAPAKKPAKKKSK